MPKSAHSWRTNLSSSSIVPSSRRRSMRSRAVSLPALCSRSRRSGPPPASASASRRRSSPRRSRCLALAAAADLSSGKGASIGFRLVGSVDAHGEVRGEPGGAEKKHDTEKQLGAERESALQGGIERIHVERGADQDEHGAERQQDDEHDGDDEENGVFHGRPDGTAREG